MDSWKVLLGFSEGVKVSDGKFDGVTLGSEDSGDFDGTWLAVGTDEIVGAIDDEGTYDGSSESQPPPKYIDSS